MKKLKLLLLLIFLALIFFYALFYSGSYNNSDFSSVKNYFNSSDIFLYGRTGKILHIKRSDLSRRRLKWIPLENISPALIKTLIISEDKNFYSHSGVDWSAALRALLKKCAGKKSGGASTVTMQLISILDRITKQPDSNKLNTNSNKEDFSQKLSTANQSRSNKKNIFQKILQMRQAIAIEKKFSKKEILESYLNLIFYRSELQGIEAAAQGIFGKSPSSLGFTESIILSSLIRSPNAEISAIIERSNVLKKKIPDAINLSSDSISLIVKQKLLCMNNIKNTNSSALHIARILLSKTKNSVTCSIDESLQAFVNEAILRNISALKEKNVSDAAAIVVDNKTSEVLAYSGSSGSLSNSRYVDGVKAKRQAGSTLKPFLYAVAFEKKILTPASILDDAPINIPALNGIYNPSDYDNIFRGHVSAREALASSLNIPAVRTLDLINVGSFISTLKNLGFQGLKNDKFYGLSLALGSADISLLELAGAYKTLANSGKFSALRFSNSNSSDSVSFTRIFSDETAFLISNILSDRDARALTFGFENQLSTKYWTAVKTGTSKDMRDNWCVGYSEKYTVAIWVGNFSGQPMWNVSGIHGAAPIWLEIMNYLHSNNLVSKPPVKPAGIVCSKISKGNNKNIFKNEYFIKGTETKEIGSDIQLAKNILKPKITYPVLNEQIALDPDIPENYQKIIFESNVCLKNIEWRLNGTIIGTTFARVSAKLERGAHIIELSEKSTGKIYDKILFNVR